MKSRAGPFTALAVPLALALLTVPGAGTKIVYAAEKGMEPPPMKVEVVVKDREKGYEVKAPSMPGVLTQLVIRNEDSVTHGFTSTLFKEVPVTLSGQGSEVQGKHFKSFHLEPGKTMTLSFTKPPTEDFDTMHYVFWCDIHPEVKGELLLVESRGEIGGG